MSNRVQFLDYAPRYRAAAMAKAAAIAVATTVAKAAASAVVTAALVLAGCASTAPKALQAEPVPPPKPMDPSYDWHVLVPAPFGSYLKEVPLALHEVLLFRDDAPGAGTPDDAECYGVDAPAPRFVGGTPDEYLVCFKQDRLARIRASVSVSSEKASEIFATACGSWMKNAAASTAPAAPGGASQRPNGAPPGGAPPGSALQRPGGAPMGNSPQTSGACEGRDGTVHFSGRLSDDVPPAAETSLSVVLDGAADPQAPSE